MNRFPFLTLIAALPACAALFLAGCRADDETADTSLPEGLCPVTFSTSVEELRASRADGDERLWAEGDVVAVMCDDVVKQYRPGDSGFNSSYLVAVDAENTFYWQSTDEYKAISAWYTGTGFSPVLPGTWSVQADQSGDGYRKSDFRYTPGNYIFYGEKDDFQLRFYHQTAKVVVRILKSELVPDAGRVTDVRLVNMCTTADCAACGYYEPSTWNAHRQVAEIIPGAAGTGGDLNILEACAALAIPQDMTGRPFIRVTVDGEDYFYTPKSGEADLQGGSQHIYNVTVKKTGLEVTVGTSVSWTDTPLEGTTADATSYRIRLTGSGPLPALKEMEGILATDTPGEYETTNGNSFSFSYAVPAGENRKGFSIGKGSANAVRTIRNEGELTYTFTFTDVHSDLQLTYDEGPQVGDFYYADGTWSPDYIPGGSPACIGIVFKAGAGSGDHASRYGGRLPSGIRGYAVSLQSTPGAGCNWGERGKDTPLENVADPEVPFYDGFANTKTILDAYLGTESWPYYEAFQEVLDYRSATPAPDTSSDWYLPSLKQLSDIYAAVEQGEGTPFYDNLTTAGAETIDGYYWTSTECPNGDAWTIYSRYKDETVKYKEYVVRGELVRAVLTF